MSKTLTYSRPQTSLQKRGSLQMETDPISYEDLLIAKYLEELKRAPPYTKTDVQVEKSPYLQKLAHTHVVPMQISRPPSATQVGGGFGMSRGRGSRPVSAKPSYSATYGGWDSGRVGLKSQFTAPVHNNWDTYNEQDRGTFVINEKSGRQKIDPRFTGNPNFGDPASPRAGRRPRPLSAPLCKRPYTCNSRPVSAKSVSYTKKARSLYRQKAQTVVVAAYKNGSRDIFARIAAPNLKMLLEACTDKLGLNTAARRIFLEDGQEVFHEKDLRRDDSVYISTGEPFKSPEKWLKETFDTSQKSQWTLSGLVCPQTDKKKSPKAKLSKHFRSLVEQSRRRVLVFQNGSGSHSAEIVTDPKKLEAFLSACTAKLDLGSCGRVLYDWDGNEVTDLEEAPVLDQCLQTWPTPVLGPLWLSKGEGFSPKGVTEFLNGLINYTKAKLKEARNYKKQLQLAQDDETKDMVEIVAILSMSPKEIEDNIAMADKDIGDFTNALNRLKEQKDKLQDQAEEEERNGSNFTMKHIQKYEIDHKLVGKKGMRLKIHENGTYTEPTVIYFNLQQASKGGEDAKQLMCRLLDQCGSITALAYPKKNPAIHPVAKKLFTSTGKEIKSVRELNYDDELWLSFGEPWRDPQTYALALQLDKVIAVEIDNTKRTLREQLLTEDTKGVDLLKSGKWEVVNSLPDEIPRRVISEPGEKESMKNLLTSNEISSDNNCFLKHREKPSVVLYGEVVVTKKATKSDEAWPPESQIWVLTKDGYFHCKSLPQFVLGLTARRVKTRLQRLGKSEDVPVEGFVVTIQKKVGSDSGQQWSFTGDGYICSKGSPDRVLTYLGARHGDEESQVTNEESGMPPGDRIYLAACAKINLTGPAKSQRWALKQERCDNLGQWRHTKADNPEWHRQALSWPTCKDGQINQDYIWPMEGYLLPYAPPLKNSQTDKNFGDAPLRLQVLKNGIKDAEKAVAVVAPDLTLMKKGVHCQPGNGQTGHNHSGSGHSHAKSGKGSTPGKATAETADAESINDTLLHCDPDQTVLKLEFNMFLDRCTSLLDLPFPARRLFDKDGLEHFNLRSLKRDQLVTVTCGEPWSDPKLSKAEQQRRYLLANLAADIAQIREYVAFRNPKKLVLEIEGRMAVGSKLIIGESFLLDKTSSSLAQESRDLQNEAITEQQTETDEKIHSEGSAHQHAHKKSDERLTRLKWPWERLYNCGDDSVDMTEESVGHSEKQRPKRKAKGAESPAELQRFAYEDGFLAMESDRSLVLGICHEVSTQKANVVLVRRNVDDILQRWILKENGLIQAKHNANLVLTATMKTSSTAAGGRNSLVDCAVSVQRKKTVQFGHANQRWKFDNSSGLVYAFSADLHDKEITAANRANVCTYAVLGKTEIDQTGYIVELPERIGSEQKILVCASCARAMRGRYRLKKLDQCIDFACAMGSAKEYGLQPIGSFRCLNGKVDLSTYEAEHTLQYWQKELERLRKETSVHAIAKEISAANTPVAVKVLAYKNGDAKRRIGELIVGSSVSGILLQSTNRLQLSQAARRLYTADGKQIMNIEDLIEWAKQAYANDGSGDYEQERSSDNDLAFYLGNDSSPVGKFVDDEKNVMIIPNPSSPIQTDGSLVEWKIYAVKPGHINLNVLCPTEDPLTYTLAYQTQCEVVDGELVIDISSQPLPVQSGDVIGFEIKDHGMIPYEVDSTGDAPFLYSALSNSVKIGDKITLQISPDPGSRCYNLQAKIVKNGKPKESPVQSKEKSVSGGKRNSKFRQDSKVVHTSADPILRYPIEVFVSCGENFSKPEKMDPLQNREQLANMSRQLEKEKHVLRMMQGRRTEEQKPSVLKPMQNPGQPVLVEGSWQEPTTQEKNKHNIVHHLQAHLQAMKANQKPKGVKTAKIDTTGRLYMQPNMKRVLVFPNGEKVELAQYVWGESILQLLDNSTTRLNLSKPARQLFTMDGDLVTNFDQIERDQILCVSSNKKFLQPQESQNLIEIKANWARTYKAYGPEGTDIVVETTKKQLGNVDPFKPVDGVKIEEEND